MNPSLPDGRGRAGTSARLDLSRIRHELRTPINHILGYTEMLLEERLLPESFEVDLQRIHAGGRQLQNLISHYFDAETALTHRDIHQLYHELRTPVNHIIGYCELLQEQAEEQGLLSPVADLKKIRGAAAEWLALIEGYLIPPPGAELLSPMTDTGTESQLVLVPGLGLHVPEPKAAEAHFLDAGAILVVDDDEQNRELLSRRLRRCGYTVTLAVNGLQALQWVRTQSFDIILLDMVMPGLDGFQTLARLKADPALRETRVIMLSALDEENGIARCIEMGAEDYLSKPFNAVFLRARIGACLEKKRLRDKERAANEALRCSQKHLSQELAKAADYVLSLLPPPVSGTVDTAWCFHPTEQLGGDAFGYHWIDEQHFAMYLLDVSGHGVGAALLSVSVLNAIRSQTLPGVDFCQPDQVLAALNESFRMEKQGFLYFTLWYGVFVSGTGQLAFASGGHPPALLIQPALGAGVPDVVPLSTNAPALGCFEDAMFPPGVVSARPGARLLLFSDGIFEIFKAGEEVGTFREFLEVLQRPEVLSLSPEGHWQRAQKMRGGPALEDDFSFLEVRLH